MPSKLRRTILVLAWLATAAWTLVIGALLVWNEGKAEQRIMNIAFAEAEANLNKDITFRRWATSHGGVYVPITETQKSVPWLAHVPGRDVTTTDGRHLTLLNPASMLRQIMDRYAADYGVRGRIVGLRYLNPANAPDPWEKEQLEAFVRGEKREVRAVAAIDGKPYLRYLRAMYMQPGCEICHAILGYKEGDMRGATGLNLPLDRYYAEIAASKHNLEAAYGAIWLLGLAGIGAGSFHLRRREAERMEALLELESTEQRYRTLFERSRDGILLVDPENRHFTDFNAVAHEQLGYSRGEFAHMTLADIEAAESAEDTGRHIELIRARGWDDFETRHRRKDGTIRDVQVIVQIIGIGDRKQLHCTFRDITERKLAERSAFLYSNIFRFSGEAIVVTDAGNRIVDVNRAFVDLTGYTADEVRGQDPRMLSSGNTPPQVYQTMWAALNASGFWQGELSDRRKDGTVYPKWVAISAIRNERREIVNFMASFTDISERKAAEERIDYLAHHDALTGLINRYSMESRLEQALLAAQRSGNRVAIMFIDMDRFKAINDTLGHHVGDEMLGEVARRLRECVRESDIVARIGGDEFVVALVGLAAAIDSAPVADKIRRRLAESYFVGGKMLHSSPSIGISVFPDDGADAQTLMKHADTAMYHVKEHGRNAVGFFAAEMTESANERMDIEHELRLALEEGRLEVHYQPQVATGDGRLCGMEALARWTHPRLGAVSPLKFISVAEESGLIEPLGAWVLDRVCRQAAAWRAVRSVVPRLAVNLSAHQLRSPRLIETVAGALDRHGLPGDAIEIEITESVAMENPERAIGQLTALRKLGIHLSIDDFGTGYSSLAYLKSLPIQTLKLDRAFVRDIETDANDAAISQATISLAHSLGLKVVAEGVETPGQRDFLARNGCDFLQGYLFGRPQPAEAWDRQWPGVGPADG